MLVERDAERIHIGGWEGGTKGQRLLSLGKVCVWEVSGNKRLQNNFGV